MTRHWLRTIGFLVALLPWQAQAELVIEITGGTEAALPIAVVPFGAEGFAAPEDISAVIRNDLASSGRFAPLMLAMPVVGLLVGHLVAGKLAGGQSPAVLWAVIGLLWVVGSLALIWAGRRTH